MESHPGVDLRDHEGYNPRVLETVDDDVMKAILSPPSFPFFEDLRSFSRLHTFEEIVASTVDEDENYHRLKEQDLQTTMHPESLGLVLAGQPLSALADLSAKFKKAGREVFSRLEPVVDDDDFDASTETPR